MKWYALIPLDHWNEMNHTLWAIPEIHEDQVLNKPLDNINPDLKVIAEADENIEVITLEEAREIVNSWEL